MNKTLALLTLFSAAGIALTLATDPGMADDPIAPGIVVAADEKTAPAPAQDPTDPILAPKTYKETPAEVAECMKTWDPADGHEQRRVREVLPADAQVFPREGELRVFCCAANSRHVR